MSELREYWEPIIFALAIGWGLVTNHFDIRELKKTVRVMEAKQDKVNIKLESDMKEVVSDSRQATEKLTEAITELIITTKILSEQIKFLKEKHEL